MAIFGNNNFVAGENFQSGTRIAGILATCPEDGTADAITVLCKTYTTNIRAKCALYDGVTNALLGVTEELILPYSADTAFEQTFNLLTKPPITANHPYYIVGRGNDANFSIVDIYMAGAGFAKYQIINYGDFPDPFVPVDDTSYQKYLMIYCTYTPGVSPPTPLSVTTVATTVTTITGPNTVSFQATPTGGATGNYTYQWHDDNGLINGATGASATISFPEVTAQTLFDIFVVVTDASESAESNQIFENPQFHCQIRNSFL